MNRGPRGRSRPLPAVLLALALAGPSLCAAGAQAQPTPAPSPLPGETVPSFDAVALAGRVEHVDFPKGSATVLLFFLSAARTATR